MRLQWIAAAVLLAWPCAAQEPEIRQFDIPTLQKLGGEIYDQDQAAWHATDALNALHPLADLQKEKVQGWIVETRPTGALVRFICDGAGGPEAAYDVSYTSGTPTVSVPSNRNLIEEEKVQYGARSLALKSVTQRCGDSYNTVVLKDPEGPGWLAWALASTHDPSLIMAGGHHRLTISADGKTVLRTDLLSRTCNAIKNEPKAGSKPEAIITTQLVSPLPVETFFFLSLQHRIPIFVVVLAPEKTLWAVEGDKLRRIEIPKQDAK
jgi:hypothetical protein